MNVDDASYASKIKATKDASDPEWREFELHSKSRDEFSKISISYLFILNSGAIAAIPIIIKMFDEGGRKIDILNMYTPFYVLGAGLICAFLAASLAWLNFNINSIVSKYELLEKVAKINNTQFIDRAFNIENDKFIEKCSNSSLFLSKFINPTMWASIALCVTSFGLFLVGVFKILKAIP